MSKGWYLSVAFFVVLFGTITYVLLWCMVQFIPPMPFAALAALITAFCAWQSIYLAYDLVSTYRRYGFTE